MFEEMPLGTDAASRARAVLAAIVLHLTIVSVAAYSTRGHAQPMTRRTPDIVRIELPRAPTRQTAAASVRSREQFPVVPSAPAVPPLRLEPPRAGSLQLEFANLDQMLATIQSMTSDGPSSPGGALDDTGAVAASEVDHLPELLGDLEPRYPDELRRAGLSGETLLEYIIDREGRVGRSSIRIISTTHPAFARSAIESLTRARFKPARRAGQSVAVVVRQKIRFENRKSF